MTDANRLSEIIGNSDYLAHRYDEVADGYRFVHVPREIHQQCTFITDEHLPNIDQFDLVSCQQLTTMAKAPAPIHFIFHSAYCCSTMMARAFDIPGISMGLKEPVVLNDMIGWRRRGADASKWREVLDQSLDLLARPLGDDKAVVIKPSNICTPLAVPMLEMRADAKALLLYAPIESFLKSIAKKEMWGRIWVRDVMLGTRTDGYLIGGFSEDDLLKLTDLQVAAIGWLSQHAAFARVIQTIGPDRIRTLDSDTFLSRPADTMNRLNDLFDLDLNNDQIDIILEGPAFTSHSKLDQATPGKVFDATARQDEQNQMAELHGSEIEMVATWTKAVAESQGIKIKLDSELLS